MSSPRRKPIEIALNIFSCIDEKGEATRWDLIKIVGNTAQFRHWLEDFLILEGFIEERQHARNYFYKKTKNGEIFHKLLKNGKIMRTLLQLSGKRLKNKKYDLPWG